VLVIDHITLIHVVDLFLVVGINYCVTELLLFPTPPLLLILEPTDDIIILLVPRTRR
jgi:hypothetical protein